MTTLINSLLPPPKQIRFVHNQGQPPSKRRRINAACLTCRKRKTRCAGERPICTTCAKNGHQCLGYSELAEKKNATNNRAGNDEDEDEYYEDDGVEDERRHGKAKNDGSNMSIMTNGSQATKKVSLKGVQAPVPHIVQIKQSEDQIRIAQRGRTSQARSVKYSEDARSSNSRSPIRRHAESHRVPYFRYFGPTAIVPGFKQMVVSVRDRRRSTGGSFSATSPSSLLGQHPRDNMKPPIIDADAVSTDDLPVYDPNDSGPVDRLILDLVKTFFVHLGCNYPFLREAKFIQMVKEKRVESILVDAVCALAARFSDLPAIATGNRGRISRAEFGHVFAQRARSATVDTFPCPSVGAVQACLLMAYEGFGANQDSALWMYLGLAIRMAVDLGLQKVVGVKYQGEKDPWYTRQWSRKSSTDCDVDDKEDPDAECLSEEEQLEVEQERIDTFWAVFVLDRVISSGTGRPVTFRDDDFELSLPEPSFDPNSGWPDPFPTFVQIIHLYGRVSDVLNNIRNAEDLTQDKWDRLAKMENDLTKLYQKQDERLHFNVGNFKAYLKAGQGTTFILLHFWFHALVIILHQPTLLSPLGTLSRTHQLLPNSRELSMSSAKTIADILAFAELIDPKSFIGNPFTSQPMYIAACAFLMESVANASGPASREVSPPPESMLDERPTSRYGTSGDKSSAKHSLLASAANQNYQRCYNSLQQLDIYWGGVRYILTALDQKSNGIWDCETYTHEEYESTKAPRRGSISRFAHFEHPASPMAPPIAWSLTGTTNSPNSSLTLMFQNINAGAAPSALGSMTSSQPLPHSQVQGQTMPTSAPTPPGNMVYDPIRAHIPDVIPNSMFPPSFPQPTLSAVRHSPVPTPRTTPTRHRASFSSVSSNGGGNRSFLKYETLPQAAPSTPPPPTVEQKRHVTGTAMGRSSVPPATYTPSSQHSSGYEPSVMPSASPASTLADNGPLQHHGIDNSHHSAHNAVATIAHHVSDPYGDGDGGYHAGITQGLASVGGTYSYLGQGMGPITDVITFDSHEIDIGALGLRNEVQPSWFEYLPDDVVGFFEHGGMNTGG